jgi:hypothetical protein
VAAPTATRGASPVLATLRAWWKPSSFAQYGAQALFHGVQSPDIGDDSHGEDPENEDEDEENIQEETANVVFAIATPPRLAGNDDPEEDASKEARRILAALMASDWKHTIAKCRYAKCSKYFQISKPGRSYANGTCCSGPHYRAVSATRAIKATRKERTHELIRVAARKFNEWHFKSRRYQETNPLKEWIAAQVSLYIGEHNGEEGRKRKFPRDDVKINWVTHNWDQIKALAEA